MAEELPQQMPGVLARAADTAACSPKGQPAYRVTPMKVRCAGVLAMVVAMGLGLAGTTFTASAAGGQVPPTPPAGAVAPPTARRRCRLPGR